MASKYNNFVKKWFKANPGGDMAGAARAWNGLKKGSASTASGSKRTGRKIPAKKKNSRRRSSGLSTRKLFSAMTKLALVAPAAGIAFGGGSGYDKMARGVEGYTGYNIVTQKFNTQPLKNTYLPFLGASVIAVGIPKIVKLIRSAI